MSYTIDEYWTDADGIQRIKDDDSYLYGLLDKYGNVIVPCKYDMIIHFDEDVRLAAVCSPYGKWGYINTSGKEVLPCEYEHVDDRFYCGRALVKKYGKYRYIDKYGDLKIQCEYDEASFFWDEMAAVKKNGVWGIITPFGHQKFSMTYDAIYVLGDGIIVAGKRSLLGFGPIKYCLFDYTAHRLTDFKYDAIGDRVLSNGRILYKKGAEKGYLDKQGFEHRTFG